MIYTYQASRLSLLRKRFVLEEQATVEELERQGKSRKEARIIAARMRPAEWPSLNVVVAGAVERRLDEPDLVGPWSPLTERERKEAALSGRWPGPSLGGALSQRHYAMPSELVERLRTTAWRVSQGPLYELRARGLVGAGLVLRGPERAVRAELTARLYPVPRIVREALARYGPGPCE
ncbi:hypothetical protein [Streptomyces celluloflavus]|uniref:hypothetical protein n=1 Tax=Streptomyces celluloflavus TaxID=58344 RepID=UPI0036B629B9